MNEWMKIETIYKYRFKHKYLITVPEKRERLQSPLLLAVWSSLIVYVNLVESFSFRKIFPIARTKRSSSIVPHLTNSVSNKKKKKKKPKLWLQHWRKTQLDLNIWYNWKDDSSLAILTIFSNIVRKKLFLPSSTAVHWTTPAVGFLSDAFSKKEIKHSYLRIWYVY